MYLKVSVQLWHFVRVSLENLTFVASLWLKSNDYLAGLNMILNQKKRGKKHTICYLEKEVRDLS